MIHRIPLPTPFQVGDVNVYLIEDDPLTLVDTGPNSGIALDTLERGLAEHGHRIEDLGLIVLTHQHIDHLGLAPILVRRSGAELAALDRLAPWLADFAKSMDEDDRWAERLMRRHGVPGDVAYALRAVASAFRGWGAASDVTRPLEAGSTLALRDRAFRVLHRPGHSPTDTIFVDEERGVVLGGDHLIGHISSNPLITRGHEHALLAYMASLRDTAAMTGISVVLPGHGEDVTDVPALVEQRFALHERRATKIHGMLADGPMTAHEVAQGLWGKVALTQTFLTLSEVLGHLDLLHVRGQAVEDEGEDGVSRFSQL